MMGQEQSQVRSQWSVHFEFTIMHKRFTMKRNIRRLTSRGSPGAGERGTSVP